MDSLAALARKPIEASYRLQPGEVSFLKSHDRAVVMENGPHFQVVNAYALQDLAGSQDRAYTREAVALRLMEVCKRLPEGCRLVILDPFRSVETQRALFDRIWKDIAQQNPGADNEVLFQKTKQFVADPDNHSRVLPHNSGGAIDLGVVGRDGKPWDFGTHFDEPAQTSVTHHFEGRYDPSSGFTQERWNTVRDNRRVLFHLMKEAGFTNNKDEWWHFDLGDNMWAKNMGQPPVYDSMEPKVSALKKTLLPQFVRASEIVGAKGASEGLVRFQ